MLNAVRSKLALKVSPPLLFLISLSGLLFTSDCLTISFTANLWQWLAATALIAVGTVISLWAIIIMKKTKTCISPYLPEQSNTLITGGIFSYSRNPMYLSLLIFLLAATVFVGSFSGLIWATAFVVLATELQIKPEEMVLRQNFPNYKEYAKRVRRWL